MWVEVCLISLSDHVVVELAIVDKEKRIPLVFLPVPI